MWPRRFVGPTCHSPGGTILRYRRQRVPIIKPIRCGATGVGRARSLPPLHLIENVVATAAGSRARRRRRSPRDVPTGGAAGDDGAGEHDRRPDGADGRHPAGRACRGVGGRRQRAALGRGAAPAGPPGPVRPRAAPPPARLPRRLLRARRRRRWPGAAVRADGRGAHPGADGPLRRVVRRLRAAAPPGRAGAGVAAAARGRARPRRPGALRARPRRRPRLRLLRPGPGRERGDAPRHDRRVGAVHGGAAGRVRGRVRGRGHARRRRRQLRRLPGDDHAPGAHHPRRRQLRPARRRRRRAPHRRSEACGWRHVQVHPLRRRHLHEVGSHDVDQRRVHDDPQEMPRGAAGGREAHRVRAGGAGDDGRQHEDEGAAGERHLRHDHLPDPGEGPVRGGVPAARPHRRLHRLQGPLPGPFLCCSRVCQVISGLDPHPIVSPV